MPLYNYVAVNSQGTEESGSMEAPSSADVGVLLKSRGLSPMSVTPNNAGPRVFGMGASVPPPEVSKMPLLISLVALLLAGTALYLVFFRRESLGNPLSTYDLSTPKAALISFMKMDLAGDIRARRELNQLIETPRLDEILKTIEFRKETTYKSTVILFVSYQEDGIKKYDFKGVEKDAKSGLWRSTYVNQYEIQDSNPALYQQLNKWKDKGEL
jgi:hypothetical protein